MSVAAPVDLLVVGGGINGTGIARDAAGRGLSVLLVEQGDLGGATSSASSKLIHGGLRYLEQFEFRLVAEALAEREVLLRSAPHLVHPMRFVMPHVPALRPAWIIRAGLLLYDVLARRQTLQASRAVDLTQRPYCAGLQPQFRRGFIYSDCWVDDARLVIATARSAAALGAQIRSRTACTAVRRSGGLWQATLQPAQGTAETVHARALVNVAGPWARSFLTGVAAQQAPFGLRLVQGSHIILPRLYDGEHAFILQNDDRRVIFAYPYLGRYTLVGTTDVELHGSDEHCAATPAEVDYLCAAVNRYFSCSVSAGDVVHRYAGIRPLFDDGAGDPSTVTRDYVLRLSAEGGEAPVLSVFGGKITTYRRLAEQALEKLRPVFPGMGPGWTAAARLDGGDCGPGGLPGLQAELARRHPWLDPAVLQALALRHGANVDAVLGNATKATDLGVDFGAGLYAREIDYFMAREWAQTGEDILWRRTKCGLLMSPPQQAAVSDYIARRTR